MRGTRSKRSTKHVSCFNSGGAVDAPLGAGAGEPDTGPLLALSGVASLSLSVGCLYIVYSRRRHSGPTYSQLSTQEDDWTGGMGLEQWDEAGRAFSEQLRTDPRWRQLFSRCSDLCAGRLEISSNAKVLIVAICAFGSITVAQTVAAVFANSLALLGDCASMAVDTLTYCGNLYAEVVPQGSPRETKKAQLIASAASLLVLTSVTIAVVQDAKVRIETETAALEAASSEAPVELQTGGTALTADGDQQAGSSGVDGVEEVNPYIVLTFAVLGLALDCATFGAFHVWGREPSTSYPANPEQTVAADTKAEKNTPARPPANSDGENSSNSTVEEANEQNESKETDGDHDAVPQGSAAVAGDAAVDAVAAAVAAGSRLNMCSAFLHVLADCMRSTTTLTEAVLIGWYGFDSERTDAFASLIVSATILLGCAAAAVVWVRSALRFCGDNAKSNRSGRNFGFVGHSTSASGGSNGFGIERRVVGVKLGVPMASMASVNAESGTGSNWQMISLEGTHGEYVQPGRSDGGATRARSPTISSQLSLDSYA